MAVIIQSAIKQLFDVEETFNGEDPGTRAPSVLEGQTVEIKGLWSIDDTLTDIATYMSINVYPPGGAIPPTVTDGHPSTGFYTATFVPDLVGLWNFQWEGLHGGATAVRRKGAFYVVRSNLDVIVPGTYS